MSFVNLPVVWAIAIIIPGVIFFFWWSWRKRQALVRLFVSERLMPKLLQGYSPARQKAKIVLLVFAILFLMFALARPQWGFVWQEANQRGRDVLIAIDTSRSMLAEDMAPNRLARAKLAALDLLRLARNDRLGLIAFAGSAFLQCPLTLDDEAFRQNINALDTSIIPQGGTALTEAIETAMTAFASEEGDNHKVLIVFTDGEDHEKGALEAAQRAADHKVKIFTVGVGTPAGEVLKIFDERGNSTYLRDTAGNVVKSRLDEDLLRQIATTGNGFYVPLREGNAMPVLYQRGLEPLPTSEISSKLVRQLNEQYHWPLGIAIALLLVEVLLPAAAKKRGATGAEKRLRRIKEPVAVAILLLFFALPADASPARAYRDYKAGQFKDARNEYDRLLEKKPDDPALNYNAGAAAYRAGAFDAAIKNFGHAIKAQDLKLQEAAYYNLGNANFRLGADQTEPDKRMAVWNEAIQNFDNALKLDPNDADAAFNKEFIKLEKLKQQQQQKNQDKNDNKDQNKDDKNQDQQQKKDQQDKDKENKDQKYQDQQPKDNQDSKSEQQKKEEQQKRDEEKKKQEQQQQQQDKDKKDKEENEGQQQGEKNQADKDQQKNSEAEQEARAAQLAQMTPKQAQQMLDAQKVDEKALIYRQEADPKKGRARVFKDW